jgi:hypothetical protein
MDRHPPLSFSPVEGEKSYFGQPGKLNGHFLTLRFDKDSFPHRSELYRLFVHLLGRNPKSKIENPKSVHLTT